MFCMHCGKELWENARFCQACGAPVAEAEPMPSAAAPVPVPAPAAPVVPDEGALFEEERTYVEYARRSVNRERLAWKSVGIVLLVQSVLLLTVAALMMAFAQGEELLVHSDYFWGSGFVSLIIAVVNLRVAKKTAALCDSVYTDIRPLIDHYSSGAPILFSAVFNLVAMAFVMDTKTKIKSRTAVLERIVKRQQTPCI